MWTANNCNEIEEFFDKWLLRINKFNNKLSITKIKWSNRIREKSNSQNRKNQLKSN